MTNKQRKEIPKVGESSTIFDVSKLSEEIVFFVSMFFFKVELKKDFFLCFHFFYSE